GLVEPGLMQVEIPERPAGVHDQLRQVGAAVIHGFHTPTALAFRGDGFDAGRAVRHSGDVDAIGLDVDDVSASADLGGQFLDRADKAYAALVEERHAVAD